MNTSWGQAIPKKKAAQAYKTTFMDMEEETKYYDPWNSVDKRSEIGIDLLKSARERIEKAPSMSTTTGGAGTAGYAMIPVYVMPEIVDRTRKETPLVELVPRMSNRGITHDYNALTAKGGANWRFEDAAQNDDVDTYDRASTVIKYGYSNGRITGQTIAGWASTGYGSAMAQDLAVKVQALKELEENTIINGDASTNPEEFDGFINLITTNTTDMSGVAVGLADIRAEYATTYNAQGFPTLCVTDATTHEYIKGLLQAFQRQPASPTEGLPFGIPGAFFYGQANFMRNQFMPTSSSSRRILFLDMKWIYMAVLQEYTYEELAHTNDSDRYMLKVYEALIMTYEGASSQIYGIL